nr:MmpS family transport accessory protein [Micromonospora sp. DSM 115978]
MRFGVRGWPKVGRAKVRVMSILRLMGLLASPVPLSAGIAFVVAILLLLSPFVALAVLLLSVRSVRTGKSNVLGGPGISPRGVRAKAALSAFLAALFLAGCGGFLVWANRQPSPPGISYNVFGNPSSVVVTVQYGVTARPQAIEAVYLPWQHVAEEISSGIGVSLYVRSKISGDLGCEISSGFDRIDRKERHLQAGEVLVCAGYT